jgi:hypothetical protein
MSKICLVVLVVALCVASTGYAQDGVSGYGYATGSDPFAAPPPSGLRFGAISTTTVYTAATAGGVAYGGGPCCTCANGYCQDWKLSPWYASWPHGPHWGHCHAGCRY